MNQRSQWNSVATLAEKVNSGQCTAQELVEKSLELIAAQEAFKTIIVTLKDRAKARAV
jgi:Asp-tRNA(Asn)/Glu-tRNA(Gln) amidotransferase A subunit family amidase